MTIFIGLAWVTYVTFFPQVQSGLFGWTKSTNANRTGYNSTSHVAVLTSCMQERLGGLNNRTLKTVVEPFHFYYGEPAVEIFNALTKGDVRRIDVLASCVRDHDSNSTALHELNSNKSSRIHDLHLGLGNTTHMEGIFQKVLLDIKVKLVKVCDQTLRDLDWDIQNASHLGIRSVRFVSFLSSESTRSPDELAAMRERRLAESKRFVIRPDGDADEANESGDIENSIEEDSDAHLSGYIRSDPNSTLTLVVLLSGRDDFFGGTVLVRKALVCEEAASNATSSSSSAVKAGDSKNASRSSDTLLEVSASHDRYEAEDVYEDEVEGAGHVDVFARTKFTPLCKPRADTRKFNAADPAIVRYTPEKGGALLIQSRFEHGVQPVTRGNRSALVIEFWDGPDTELGESRPVNL